MKKLLIALAGGLLAAQDSTSVSRDNPVDTIIQAKWKELKIKPNRLSTDEEFLRRATLDLIGTLPQPEEVVAFLKSTAKDKREKKIDELLASPLWADFWADRLSALLLSGQDRRKFLFLQPLREYLKERLAKNTGYDKIVEEMLTADGTNKDEDKSDSLLQSFLFQDRSQRKDLTAQISKVFMGIQLQCAQCHDHPFEKWTQEEFFSIVANFAPTSLRIIDRGENMQAPIDDTREIVERPSRFGFRPEGFKISVKPKFFDGKPVEGESTRAVFAKRLVSPENVQFARATANRIWSLFTGQGFVEPVDDFNVRNQPQLPELLDALAKGFVDSKFDLKWIMRTIATSKVYQLSSSRREGQFPAEAQKYYAHAIVRPMTPEQQRGSLLRAQGMDEGFGRPFEQARMRFQQGQQPTSDSPGEYDPNLQEVMRMLDVDSPMYRGAKARGRGRLSEILRDTKKPDEVVAQLYLATMSRYPTRDELARCLKYYEEHGRSNAAFEDIFFVLLNTNEFFFNH